MIGLSPPFDVMMGEASAVLAVVARSDPLNDPDQRFRFRLLGGVIVSQTSPTTGLIVAAAAFIASTYATVASQLRDITDYRNLSIR